MTTTTGAGGTGTASARAAGQRTTHPAAAGAKADTAASPPARAGAAAVIDLSAAARRQLAGLVGGPKTEQASAGAGIRSFDETVRDRSQALADRLKAAFTKLGIPLDEPIKLQLDAFDAVKTDSPYKKKIEKLFADDPDLAKEYKDVAGLNAMRAAQKALEAFEAEKRAAKDDDALDAAYGRYTARLMTSQDLSGTMTLDDGKLRSASREFMDRSVGEVPAAKASTKAEQVAGQRVARSV